MLTQCLSQNFKIIVYILEIRKKKHFILDIKTKLFQVHAGP